MALASKTGEVKFYAKGDKGAPGARPRMREWTAGTRYVQGADGEVFYDVVVYLDKLYLCLVTHTAAAANNPQTSVAQGLGYWEAATEWVFVATKLLLTEKIKAGEIDTDSLVATGLFAPLTSNPNLLRNSGMYDTDGWIGNNSPQSAVFQGYECMKCTGYGDGRYTTDGRNIDYGDLPASGQYVTISADVYATAPCYLYLGFEGLSPSLHVEETGKWVRVHHTQTIASSNGNFVVYLMSSGVTAYIKNVKLEAGGTATAYSTAEDALERTGIHLKERKIILNSENTEVTGDLIVRGSMRSPFTYAPSDTQFEYSDNVAMMTNTNGITDPFNLPWDVNQSGRRITIVNYFWDNKLAQGHGAVQAPSGKWFYEDGIYKDELRFSREAVELLGYGTSTVFYGWIVMNRINVDTEKKYGRKLNCLAMGRIIVNGSQIDAANSLGVAFDGTEMTAQRISTGQYRIYYKSAWLTNLKYLIIEATGMVTNGIYIKASVGNIIGGSFDVFTSDDASLNDGSFMFMVYNMGDWLTSVPNLYD